MTEEKIIWFMGFLIMIIFIVGCQFNLKANPDYYYFNNTVPSLPDPCVKESNCYHFIYIDNPGGNSTKVIDFSGVPDGKYLMYGRQLGGNVTLINNSNGSSSDLRLPPGLSILLNDSDGAILFNLNSSSRPAPFTLHVVGSTLFMLYGVMIEGDFYISPSSRSGSSGGRTCAGDCTAMRHAGDSGGWEVVGNTSFSIKKVVIGQVRQTNLTENGTLNEVTSLSNPTVSASSNPDTINNSLSKYAAIQSLPEEPQNSKLSFGWIVVIMIILFVIGGIFMFWIFKRGSDD